MKKILTGALCAVSLTACTNNAVKVQTSGLDFANLDTTVAPGDDFFKFATGNWINNNPQPPTEARWGSFTKLGDDNIKQINELITEIAAQPQEAGSIAQKIGDLYNMSMDSLRLNNEGAAPLKPYLDKIAALATREDLIKTCATEHDNLFFYIMLGADMKNSAMNIVGIGQSGLSLGDRDYYLADDPQTVTIREAFKMHMVNLYKLCGMDEATATKKMQTVMNIETEIAKVTVPRVELRNPEANYHKMSIADLKAATGGKFDWDSYLKAYGYDQTTEVDLGQIEPVKKACELLLTLPLEDLKTVYEWQTISSLSGLLSDDFTAENFAFQQVLTGAREMQPRWKRSIQRVNDLLGDAVGQLYVAKYFPAENKERMVQLVKNLQSALGERIQAQPWMSDSTKAVALEKLSTFYVKVGYPDKWDDLSKLNIDSTLTLVDNIYNAGKFFFELDKEKHYNKPIDRDEWGMTPQTVNAYYNPTTNEICFPAAILQPPFFDMSADDAMNYGAIGVVIGHEMTHGFDDQGRQFDKDGNLKVWWTQSDIDAFQVPAQKLTTFFDSLYVLPDLHANGALCLGENLADHGGLMVSYTAYKHATEGKELPAIDGYTADQRFFLSYANVWAGVSSEEIIRYLTRMDVHSINYLRVNGTLPHIDAWYDAFNITPENKLYLPKEDRVSIW